MMPPVEDFFLDLFSLLHWYIFVVIVYYPFAPIIYKMINK